MLLSAQHDANGMTKMSPAVMAMASAHRSLASVGTVKTAVETPVPPTAVTPMGPVVAPAGTVTVMLVAEFSVKVGATVALNVTWVVPVK